jgi:hypothetical protein
VYRERISQVDRGTRHDQLMLGGTKITVPAATEQEPPSPYDAGIIEADLSGEFPLLPD